MSAGHTITIEPANALVTVTVDGVKVAESQGALVLLRDRPAAAVLPACQRCRRRGAAAQ